MKQWAPNSFTDSFCGTKTNYTVFLFIYLEFTSSNIDHWPQLTKVPKHVFKQFLNVKNKAKA